MNRSTPRLPGELSMLVCAATSARAAHVERRVQRLWEGYGEVLRVRLEGAAASSVIVKWVSPPEAPSDPAAQRSHQRKLHSYEVERAFYTHFAPDCDHASRVPRALACTETERGRLFVLEDLDALGYGLRKHVLTRPEIEGCLDWLAAFHATFLGVEPTGLWPQGTYWHLETRADELARVVSGRVRDAAPALDRLLRECTFRTLVHGDAKVENFCFAGDGAVAAVDFQYVGGGPGVRDVCYFLSSCLGPEQCVRESEGHLNHYFGALRATLARKNRQVDVAALEHEWRRLFPVAWADFYRFLLGWSPEAARSETYGRELFERTLRGLIA